MTSRLLSTLCVLSLLQGCGPDASHKTASKPPATKWRLLQPGPDLQLSGEQMVRAELFDPAFQHGDLSVLVDGKLYNVMGQGATMPGNARRITEAVLETRDFGNGPHRLEVRDRSGRSESVRLQFRNALCNLRIDTLLDPHSRGKRATDPSRTATIRAELVPAQPWTVTLRKGIDQKPVIREFRGHGPKINVAWDGKDTGGREVPDDEYDLEITLPQTPGDSFQASIDKYHFAAQ